MSQLWIPLLPVRMSLKYIRPSLLRHIMLLRGRQTKDQSFVFGPHKEPPFGFGAFATRPRQDGR